MKALIWVVFALLTSLWTVCAAVMASLAGWLSRSVNVSDTESAVRTASEWPIPPWLSFLIDPAWIEWAQMALAWSVGHLASVAPFLSGALGWLVPLIWLGWGLVQLILLVIAGLAHVMVGRHAGVARIQPHRVLPR
jgi:hypothetical protein